MSVQTEVIPTPEWTHRWIVQPIGHGIVKGRTAPDAYSLAVLAHDPETNMSEGNILLIFAGDSDRPGMTAVEAAGLEMITEIAAFLADPSGPVQSKAATRVLRALKL